MKTTPYLQITTKRILVKGLVLLAGCALVLPTVGLGDAQKKYFTGTETFLWPDFGQAQQFTDGVTGFVSGFQFHAQERMTDDRLSGESIIGWNAILDLATFSGPQWGSFHLENAGGAWDGYWQGTISSEDGHVTDHIVCTAVGSGNYEGRIAVWDYQGKDWSLGNPLNATGYIVEAKGGPADLPLLGIGSRVDRVQLVPGVFLNPANPNEVLREGVLGRIDIQGEAQVSHSGRCKEQGLGIFDPASGAVTGMGNQETANGDLISWVVGGTTTLSPDGETAVFTGLGHIAGGTGRFEAATGGFQCNFLEQMEPTDDPLVSVARYTYRVLGKIRYANGNPNERLSAVRRAD